MPEGQQQREAQAPRSTRLEGEFVGAGAGLPHGRGGSGMEMDAIPSHGAGPALHPRPRAILPAWLRQRAALRTGTTCKGAGLTQEPSHTTDTQDSERLRGAKDSLRADLKRAPRTLASQSGKEEHSR